MKRVFNILGILVVGALGGLMGHYLERPNLPAPSPEVALSPVPFPERLSPAPHVAASETGELAALKLELAALRAQVARQSAALGQDTSRRDDSRQAEKARVLETQVDEAEQRFREEPVDPDWSRLHTESLSRTLGQYPALNGSVECRSAACRVSMEVGSGETGDETLMSFVQTAEEEFGQIAILPGANGGKVLYLSPAVAPDPDLSPGLQPRISVVSHYGE